MNEIYLDANATTATDPHVLEAMQPWLDGRGNPSCAHSYGQEARAAIDEARRTLSGFFGCGTKEIVFTSGGTESNNWAIKGAAFARQEQGKHILVSATEHPSVRTAAHWLTRFGFEVEEIPCTPTGQITPEALHERLRDDTILVSVMTAQNEVGTINRVETLAEVVRGRRIVFHTDAAQAVGKIPTAFGFLGADLMSIAGHKMYGPKGVGCLIVRQGLELEPLFHGAGHEGGRRAGTENTAGIVGLAAAVERARSVMASTGERMVALRDGLHLRLAEALDGVVLNGDPLDRLPNTLNLFFLGVTGADIAARAPRLLLSTRAACSDRSAKPSPTFAAMGLGPDRAGSAIRISLGRKTTWDQVEDTAELIIDAVHALREGGELQPSDRPQCPRCELHPLKLELTGIAPRVTCERNPDCRYEAYLAAPEGAEQL